METTTYAPGVKVHVFELAGLGKAPYRLVGVRENRFVSGDGSVSKPGGGCQYCGQGILWEFILRSSDGRTFHVGSDCVLKHDDDRALRVAVETEVQKRQRAARHARAEAKRQVEVAFVNAWRDRLPEVAELWRQRPHPQAASGPFFASKTRLDWAEWMLDNAGHSGRVTTARAIQRAIEEGL